MWQKLPEIAKIVFQAPCFVNFSRISKKKPIQYLKRMYWTASEKNVGSRTYRQKFKKGVPTGHEATAAIKTALNDWLVTVSVYDNQLIRTHVMEEVQWMHWEW